jgi:hypothetical protein
MVVCTTRLVVLGGLWMALSGCAYRLQMDSRPSGAQVTLPSDEIVSTPEVVPLVWVPFGHQRVTVSAPGYRTFVVDLRKQEITAWHVVGDLLAVRRLVSPGAPDGRVEFVLVPDHGPAGTWNPAEQGLEE